MCRLYVCVVRCACRFPADLVRGLAQLRESIDTHTMSETRQVLEVPVSILQSVVSPSYELHYTCWTEAKQRLCLALLLVICFYG